LRCTSDPFPAGGCFGLALNTIEFHSPFKQVTTSGSLGRQSGVRTAFRFVTFQTMLRVCGANLPCAAAASPPLIYLAPARALSLRLFF
jgi:hypothetical protein